MSGAAQPHRDGGLLALVEPRLGLFGSDRRQIFLGDDVCALATGVADRWRPESSGVRLRATSATRRPLARDGLPGEVDEPHMAENADHRRRLMHDVGMNLPVLTSESDWTARQFAKAANLSAHQFHALVLVAIADMDSETLTAGGLRDRMGLSGPAITYLLQGLAEAGLLSRDNDPSDRRKVIIHQTDRGQEVVKSFFREVGDHVQHALAPLANEDLEAAHRTFQIMVRSMKEFRVQLGS